MTIPSSIADRLIAGGDPTMARGVCYPAGPASQRERSAGAKRSMA